MPNCTFKIDGEIQNFSRIEDAFKAIRTQSEKLLNNWKIELNVQYTEAAGKGELPQ